MSSSPPSSAAPHKALGDYRFDRFSQSGEDGVIARILEYLPDLNRWCVEFGAWNGINLSNSRRLIVEDNYSAVLIEGDPLKFKELETNYSGNPAVTALNAMVGWEGADKLDVLLSNTSIPFDFDVLSIDIDGNDYHVWAAVERYRPKLVVIEVNATIPNEVFYVQSRDQEVQEGCSLRSVIDLGRGLTPQNGTIEN